MTARPALAQQSSPQQGVNETITVTANKRAENIQSVPVSVTAVSEGLIDQLQAGNLNDLSAYVPGLNVQPSGTDANRLIIRGLSTGPNDLSPTVGVYIDEVPFGSNSGYALGAFFSPDVDPFDLDHVEVLRGPQGTLYGASTLAGLVKYVTKAPDPTQFDGHIRVDFGDDDESGAVTEAVRAGLNIPILRDQVALRVSGFQSFGQGNLTDVRTGEDGLGSVSKQGGRADLLIKPNQDLTIDLIGIYDFSRTPNAGIIDGNAATLQPVYGQYAGYNYANTRLESNYYVLEGNVSYRFEDGITATSSSSFSRFAAHEVSDDTTIFQPALGALGPLFDFPGVVAPVTKKVTEEFRLASPSNDQFEWLGGFFYDHEDSNYLATIDGDYAAGTPPAALVPVANELSNYETVESIERYVELAGFGSATYYITPDFDVNAGLRYSHNDQHLTSIGSGLLALEGVIPSFATATSSDSVFTESFGARWRFEPDAMLYTRIARGYRPGGPNLTGTSFGPDSTWNYELGLKGSALDGKLTADVAAFYIDWSNIQLNFFNGSNTIIGNAGDARSDGVEFEGTYSPINGLKLGLNGTYTDAVITSLVPGATGGAAVGDALPFSSRWAVTAKSDYYFTLPADLDANIGASLRYKSSFNTTFPGDTGNRFYTLSPETFIDLRAGLSYENYTLNFQILNLADERDLSSASENLAVPKATADAFGQPAFLTYTAGRTFGLSLAVQF